MRRVSVMAVVLLAVASGARATEPHSPSIRTDTSAFDYAQDQIVVSTEGRSRLQNPTATCLVWANAEGFGVGPAQLGGLHGVTLTLVVHPLAGETPRTFAQALSAAKVSYPGAPDWLMRTLAANQPGIEAACGEDHAEPYAVHRITRADTRSGTAPSIKPG